MDSGLRKGKEKARFLEPIRVVSPPLTGIETSICRWDCPGFWVRIIKAPLTMRLKISYSHADLLMAISTFKSVPLSLPLFASVVVSLYSPLSSCRLVVYTFCLFYVKQPKSDCHGCRQYDPDNQYPVQF